LISIDSSSRRHEEHEDARKGALDAAPQRGDHQKELSASSAGSALIVWVIFVRFVTS